MNANVTNNNKDDPDLMIINKTNISDIYPYCEVEDIKLINDGRCNNYGNYNTLECGYDGTDCIEFNSKFPNCTAADPSLLGDGECDNYHPYYTQACGWDRKDCDTVVSVWVALIGLAYVVIPFIIIEARRRRREIELEQHEEVQMNEIDIAQRERRREIILTNIIYKVCVC